jgi:hypothetical protein
MSLLDEIFREFLAKFLTPLDLSWGLHGQIVGIIHLFLSRTTLGMNASAASK